MHEQLSAWHIVYSQWILVYPHTFYKLYQSDMIYDIYDDFVIHDYKEFHSTS